ncbi:hypothetical protein AB833_24545 [Chromatiales bacterium (ex Bugula neritina AB1)]|nr:hypothetical protein AB833_24545 [Chromatiales bacterium (ex Bugula neritina AB1)]
MPQYVITKKGGIRFLALAITLCLTISNATVHSETQQQIIEKRKAQLAAETIHILGGIRSRVPRWNDTVRMAIIGGTASIDNAIVRSLTNELSLYSGINIEILQHNIADAKLYLYEISNSARYAPSICDRHNQRKCANFVVIISSQSDMNRIARAYPMRPIYQKATNSKEQVHCFFSPGIAPNFEIKRGIVFVNNNLDDQMRQTCLQEEIYQSFGLFNDYTNSTYYSFNNMVEVKKITRFDKMLLSSLYDRAHPPGTLARTIAMQMTEY